MVADIAEEKIPMRKMIMTAVAVLAMTVLVTGSALAASKGTNRPFSGTGAGATTVSGGPSSFSSTSAGNAISTHLGNGTYTISATQTWGLDALDQCAGSSIIATDAGSATFTAANGSTVTGTVAGITCELAPFNDTTYATTLTLTVSPSLSTGRFFGATGSIVISGTSTATATPGSFNDTSTMTGTISY
jgi:hypothetical protein